jgi:diacylglycerol kinase family enzyme
LILTLGGDGRVNEVVNGILGPSGPAAEPSAAAKPLPAAELPALAAIPGGSGNVFAGALGLPRDPIDATGQILRALADNHERTIGLGNADGRYFTFSCGIGLDAEVVRAVQGLRAHGKQASPSLYVRLTLRQFYRQTDRSEPFIWIDAAGQPPEGPVFLGIVSNTAPWTYLGDREVNANPQATFDTGLDIFAMRDMSSFSALTALRQMLGTKRKELHSRSIVSLHDQPAVTLRAERPAAFQIDGEYVGERELTRLRSVPRALRVFA